MKNHKKLKHYILCFTLMFSQHATAKTLNYTQWETNKIPITYYHNAYLPMAEVALIFKAGSGYSPVPGLANLTAETISKASMYKNPEETEESWIKNGGRLSLHIDQEKSVFLLKTLTGPNQLNKNIQMLVDLTTSPSISKTTTAIAKNETVATIQQMMNNSSYLNRIAAYKQLYRGSNMSNPVLGNIKTLEKITTKDVIKFYKNNYTKNNVRIIAVGNISKRKVDSLARILSRKLKNSKTQKPLKLTFKYKPKIVQTIFPSKQTSILLSQPSIAYKQPYYYSLKAFNYALGVGMHSILFKSIREKHKLSYSSSSRFKRFSFSGPFFVSMQTTNQKSEIAVNITNRLLRTLAKKGLTQKQIRFTKSALTGSFDINLSTNDSVMSNLINISFYNLPKSFLNNYKKNIEKVNNQTIKHSIALYIPPNNWSIFTTGNNHAKS